MWSTDGRAGFLAVAAVLVCAAFTGLGYMVRGSDVEAATARGQAALNALREDYQKKLAAGEAATRVLFEDEILKSVEVDRVHQAELAAIQAAADRRPPRVVRLPCTAGTGTVPAAGGGATGDPGQPDEGAPDGRGMGPDDAGGYRQVDLTGYDGILDRAKEVSSQLRNLQARCAL